MEITKVIKKLINSNHNYISSAQINGSNKSLEKLFLRSKLNFFVSVGVVKLMNSKLAD